jgi:hypothetical protein
VLSSSLSKIIMFPQSMLSCSQSIRTLRATSVVNFHENTCGYWWKIYQSNVKARQHFAKGIQMNNASGVATDKRHH